MRRARLSLEDHRDVLNPSTDAVRKAVHRMASATGPTWVVLEDRSGSYIQAAGSSGRYVVESRDAYGEGFRHWRMAVSGDTESGTATIFFRNQCPNGKHPRRGCPISVPSSEVVSLDDVLESLTHYAVTGERDSTRVWHDATVELLPGVVGDEIHDIQPRSTDE